MKNENASAPFVTVFVVMAIIILCAAGIRLYLDSNAPKYIEEITIADAESDGGGYYDFLIISADNIEYKTNSQRIYFYALSHIGQRVKLVYVAGNNNECYVTEIHLITNRTVCTVDKCGTPV